MIDEKKLLEFCRENGAMDGLLFMDDLEMWIADQLKVDVPDTNVGRWIPCSERLPECFEVVCASIRAETGYIKKPYVRDVCKAYLCSDGSWEVSLVGIRGLVVEAWMSLPEPYKEGE